MITFGPFRYEASSRLLYRDDQEIPLPLRVAAVLESLLKRPGEIVAKDAVLASAWEGAFVGEDSLTQAISQLRQALGDDPHHPTYIQTIPKRGYRFVAEVSEPLRSQAPWKPAKVDDEDPGPKLAPGVTLGHYQVVAALGAGAMGQVWRARDTELQREVALKVVSAELAGDAEVIERFRREAVLLAALNHPNIATIHGVEEAHGTRFIVMELLEGETLQERIERGSLPMEEALSIGRQVTEALEVAHERGIIHRDLKPANVVVTAENRVKVLDFGLAKEVSAGVEARPGTATTDATGLTKSGMLLGTAPYMSPEQVRGQPADKRADIWAFGCLLYEMLTGARAFGGDTTADALAAIVDREPDWGELPDATPATLRLSLHRCLAKDPRDRLHDIADARIEIEEALARWGEGPVAGPIPDTVPRWRRAFPWAVAVGALCVAIIVVGVNVGGWGLSGPASSADFHGSIALEPGLALSGGPGFRAGGPDRLHRQAMVISPRGDQLVYCALDEDEDVRRLYLRRVDQSHATAIPGTEGGCCPFFSPDGRSVGFFTGRGGEPPTPPWTLKAVDLSGGEVRTIARDLAGGSFGATWGETNTIVFTVGHDRGLLRVSAEGGDPRPLTEIDLASGQRSHRLPHFLPDGDTVLFTVTRHRWLWDDADIIAVSLSSGQRKPLGIVGADARYVSSGHLVYARDGTLMRVPFDPVGLEVSGEPVPILERVMQSSYDGNEFKATGTAQFSVSETGTLVYVPGGIWPEREQPLVWVHRDGQTELIATPAGQNNVPRVSHDGRYIAYAKGRWGLKQVWVYDMERGTARPLTEVGGEGSPVWSPDGKRIVFSSDKEGGFSNLYVMNADGTGEIERLTISNEDQYAGSWSVNGVLAFVQGLGDIWALSMDEPERDPWPLLDSSDSEQHPAFSPDGKWLAYVSNKNGANRVWVRPYPGEGASILVSTEQSSHANSPAWSPDGRRVFYRSSGRMMVVDVTPGRGEPFGDPAVFLADTLPFGATYPIRDFDVTDDGRFVMRLAPFTEPQPVTSINVVLNWFERLAPGGR